MSSARRIAERARTAAAGGAPSVAPPSVAPPSVAPPSVGPSEGPSAGPSVDGGTPGRALGCTFVDDGTIFVLAVVLYSLLHFYWCQVRGSDFVPEERECELEWVSRYI